MNLSTIRAAADDAARTARERADLAIHGRRGPGALGTVLIAGLGAAVGAAASFLLDPARGRARRARLVDQGGALVRRAGRSVDATSRRLQAGAQGRMAAARAARTPSSAPLDDATLTDRVKSTVLRDESVPKHSVNINVERGMVVLRGEVPDEATRSRLVADVEAVDGVWSVRDLLHLPGEAPVTAGDRTGSA